MSFEVFVFVALMVIVILSALISAGIDKLVRFCINAIKDAEKEAE